MPRPPFYEELPPVVDYWEAKDPGYKVPRFFTSGQIAQLQADANFRAATDGGSVCPVCLNKGSYKYQGKTYECPDDSFGHPQLRLSMLYFLANIPIQYQHLVWSEWPDKPPRRQEIKEDVEEYINNFDSYRFSGIGMTFWSKATGTGKTWMATQILKSVVKRGYDGWFVSFKDMKNYYERDDAAFYERRIMEAQVLVLDEIAEPWSDKAERFFADKLEDLIRPRTNANLPTILATNLDSVLLQKYYPRVFSLVEAKNLSVEMPGADARVAGLVVQRNYEVPANGERFPIE